ncbi:MAG: putative RNA-binding protein [Stygiobacter sp.]|nr:MAG: putative RNA-binding protein [Stygiobacter sp.]KAF0213345.1 MAG: putative RNA-binding [Ignavibacteria bacterium]
MYKNYFYLLRASQELNSILSGKKLYECYTQERDKLFLHIPLEEFSYFHFIISTNPQEFHFYFKDEHRKAKKNTADFFGDLLPQKIKQVKMAFGERIIAFELESGTFYILFRGSKSNCFLLDSKKVLHPFKKIADDQLAKISKELSDLEFVNSTALLLNSIAGLKSLQELKALPYLSKEILRQVESKVNSVESAVQIIGEIINGKIVVGIDVETGDTVFRPISFLDSKKNMEVELFDNYFEAITKYFHLKHTNVKTHNAKHEIEKFIENEIEKSASKLNNLKARIENGSKEEEYQKNGELLLSVIGQINKRDKEIIVEDWKTNQSATIKIDPKLSPHQNVNSYFDKARSEKIEFEKSAQLYKSAKAKFDRLLVLKDELTTDTTVEQLQAIKKELKMNTQQNSNEDKKDKLPFRHFLIDGKYHFYIGKDSKNNDMLTTKFAKQNDFWFHARSVAGSHGVLRVENTKEAIPKRVLEKAASITAFYSKSKTAKLAPVTYTLKKYVSKNARHEPGQVSVMKESVLLVRPEIPSDCEYIEE